jgi:hypothetical protein
MLRRLAALLALLLPVAPAAAQPACTAPPGPLRDAVCADAGLRAADARLRGLERALAAAASRPATLAWRARAWQARLEAGPRQDLADEYADRIAELEEGLRQDRAMRRLAQPNPVFPRPPTLETRCLGAVLSNCRVTAAGLAVAEDGRTRVLWQRQAGFTPRDGGRAGIVLLAEARGGWRLLGWSFDAHDHDAPRLAAQEGVTLLHLPGRAGGSGGRNADLFFRHDATGWAEVEAESWREGLAARLPPGFEALQAVEYDAAEMTARTPLWREGDAQCCASGGAATLELRLESRSLALAAVRLDATARALAPRPETCPAERATYRMAAPADFTAELHGGLPGTGFASDLALRVRSPATGREYWFVFTAAQGYGGLSVLPVARPDARTAEDGLQPLELEEGAAAHLGFHALDAALAVHDDPPRSGRPAPRHLFMPGLGLALHYGMLPEAPDREAMPIALWTLAGCR